LVAFFCAQFLYLYVKGKALYNYPRNAMKKLFVLILLFYFLLSCAVDTKKEEPQIQKDFKSELKQYFIANYENIVNTEMNDFKLDSLAWLHQFYRNNNYTTIWINDSVALKEDGVQLINQLSNSKNFGLDTRLYDVNAIKGFQRKLNRIKSKGERYNLASTLELLLTHYYMQHGKHLNYGIVNEVDSFTKVPKKKFKINLPKYLQSAVENDSVIDKLLNLQPKHLQYQNLQKGLTLFLQKSSLATKSIEVPNFRIDSLKAIKQAKKALELHRYLNDQYNDSVYLVALAKFQIEHGLIPDMLIGNKTAEALSISPYRYYKQIAANLERWRWKKEMPLKYLCVNIPGFTIRLFNNNIIEREHKIIVGKVENQTPEMIDSLEYIIAYPFWHVPRSISINEILVNAQKDTTYINRNNYEILNYSNDKLDPNSINWKEVNEKNFNYLIRQKGGVSNALGLVKFIFPNENSIYLHDTPTKYYFNFETRAYSHGCVRVQHALDLADHILSADNNKYTLDSVFKYIDKKEEKSMLLNTKIPIYIVYFTTSVDSSGNIIFYNDVYKKDDKLIGELSKSIL